MSVQSEFNDTLKIANLSKTYGKKIALKDFSLSIKEGEIHCIVGPNGAGKSTILNCISGLIVPNSGNITFYGHPLLDNSDPSSLMGFLTEKEGLNGGMKVKHQLKASALATGVSTERLESITGPSGVQKLMNNKISTLSNGERKRVAIAIALLKNPKLLILDEPQNGLDAEGIVWLRNLLKNYAIEGNSVLLCSHWLNELEKTATNVTVLQVSRLFQGTISEFTGDASSSFEDHYFQLINRKE